MPAEGLLRPVFDLLPDRPAAADRAPAESRPAAGIEVEVTDGLLTLDAHGAPLAEVPRAIGEAGDFEVVLCGAFATPVREAFVGRPLEDAIRGLLEGHSVIVRRESPDAASGAAALAEVRVIENPNLAAAPDAMPGEPSPGNVEVAKEADARESMDREAFRLAHLGAPPPTREDILLELGDPDQSARVAAVPLVGSLGPGAAVDILSGVLVEEDDPLVRSRAVAALGRLEGPGARALLREQALGDEDAELRMQALNALASSRGERGINVLAQALRQDPAPEVRLSAIRALERLGGDRARRILEHAARDFDPATSLAAEHALAAWRS